MRAPAVPALIRWRHPAGRPRARLVCFPHAGGGASTFSLWDRQLPESVELIAVQPPGRETRIGEPAPDDLQVLLGNLADDITFTDRVPSTLFGHSWGAILAYELSKRLVAAGCPPDHLIVSGARAPHCARALAPISHLPKAELLAELTRLNGISPEVLAHDEYVDLLIPTFRADLKLAEEYRPADTDPLPCPITALGGAADPMTSWMTLDGWRRYTSAEFRLAMFPGDHFFIASRRAGVLRTITDIVGHDERETDGVPPAGQNVPG